MTQYLEINQILEIHAREVESHGGTLGLRDEEMLESALGRLQTGHYDDIVAEAAALMESLAGNHPFVEGNKRTAVAATDVFLNLNGYRICIGPMEFYDQINAMFQRDEVTLKNKFTFKNIEAMLRRVVKKEAGEDQ